MTLFPGDSVLGYDDRDLSIHKIMNTAYNDSLSINQVMWAESDLDARFEAGDQSVFTELYNFDNLNSNFTFNHLRSVKNMISGHQRQNRKSTIVVPVENADQKTADQFTKIFSWCDRQEGILHTLSDAYDGALVTGLNLLHVWMDYRNDPESGDIRVDNCSYNSFLIDPFFRKKDLSDCNFVWKRSYLAPQIVASLMPKKKKEIATLAGSDGRDEKFYFMPENYYLHKSRLLAYDEFYYRAFRKKKLLVDTQSKEVQEWTGNDEQLKQFLAFAPQVIVKEAEVPTVKLAILANGKVLYDGKNPSGIDMYPFIPILAYFNPQLPEFSKRIQGVIRGLRDAQFLYNRMNVNNLDILESKANTGYFVKEGTLVDPTDAHKVGNGATITLKKSAEMTDIQPIPTQPIPPSFFQLASNLSQEIMRISGVNEELLGAANDDKAGILSMLRQGSALTTLQGLFDQLDQSQKLLGKVMLQMIQNNFVPAKVRRIIEDEPTQQFYNKSFGRYDAAVEEGLNTTTQRQMQFAQLLHLKEAGVPVPDDVIIKAATVQNKDELLQSIAQSNEQAQQAQQAQLEVQLQETQARIKALEAKALSDTGWGYERFSRIPENRQQAIENSTQAQANVAKALLDVAKTLQEMDQTEISQIQEMLQLKMVMNQVTKPDTPLNQSANQGALNAKVKV